MMILIIACTALIVTALLSSESINLSLDWQAMMPMMDDTLTLIGLLLAIVVYILVIAFRTHRLITAPIQKRELLNIEKKKHDFNENEPVLSFMPPVIHNLNQ